MADADLNSDIGSDSTIMDLKEELSDALDLIQSSGKFAAFEKLDGFVDPKLFVPGIGTIQLPLQQQTAESLIHICHQAPFGKGEQTVIDSSVRNTWQVDATQFELRNPAWGKYVKQITRSALKELGFDEDDMFGVRAELYKLLLYEKGAVFKPHKEYSDVLHEITPITNGYRCVLTFNLTADPQGARPSAKTQAVIHEELHGLLKRWQSDVQLDKHSSYRYLVHLIDHEYTEQGLKFQSLKGRDFHVANIVSEACSATGVLCFLASCERRVSGACDEYEGYGYSSSFHQSGGFHEILEVYDNFLRLKRVVDLSGDLVAEDIDISDENFLEQNVFDGELPDDEDYSGFTGNEGASATHWYRDTVVVMVPKATLADFLINGSALSDSRRHTGIDVSRAADNLLNYFQKFVVTETDGFNHSMSLRTVCQKILSTSQYINITQGTVHRAFTIAARVGDVSLLEIALSCRQKDLAPEDFPSLGKLLSSLSLEQYKKVLTNPINSLTQPYKRYEFVRHLTTALNEHTGDQSKEDIEKKADWLLSTVDEVLGASDPLEANDASAIFSLLAEPRLPNNFLDRVELLVQRNHKQTLFMIQFLAHLCEVKIEVRDRFPQDKAMTVFKSEFPHFVAQFDMRQLRETPRGALQTSAWRVSQARLMAGHPLGWPQKPTSAAGWEAVSDAATALPRLYRQALDLGLYDQVKAMLVVIENAADTYHIDHFKHLFLPFLRAMLPILKERGISLSNPDCRHLYQSILSSYARRFVGEKPLSEQDWSRTPISCSCDDCRTLNTFITSPTHIVGRFPMNKNRRYHIHQQLDMFRGHYTHITERMGSPYTLVVTKTRAGYESKVRAWETRSAEAKAEFEFYGDETLQELLGDRFDEITGLCELHGGDERAGKRLKVGTAGANQYQVLSSNPHAQNIGGARTAGGVVTKRKFVDTIDLTEE